MTGDCHAGICGSPEVRPLRATRPRLPDARSPRETLISHALTRRNRHIAEKTSVRAVLREAAAAAAG